MSLKFQLKRKTGGRAELGESPFWDSGRGDIWWVDITGKQLFRTNTESGETRYWQTPEMPGFVVLTASGRPAVGMETGIFLFDDRRGAFDQLIGLERVGHRFNDATVDQAGRLWTSTMTLDAQRGAAAVQFVSRDLKLQTVAEGLTIPNGLAVDVERGRLFYSDSHPDVQTIWMRPLQADQAVPGEASVFARTTNLQGRPDGAALDTRGFYWIAGVDGSALHVFGLDGQLDATFAVPFPSPTKVSFFGPEGRSIALTSKNVGEEGGYLALTDMPETFSPGVVQPCWNSGQ